MTGKTTKIVSIFFSAVVLLPLCVYLLVGQFDNNLFSVSTVESIQIKQRQQYYIKELGKIYGNRVGIYYFDNLKPIFRKFNNNLFSTLDLRRYFSSSTYLIPLFVIGLLSVLRNFKKIFVVFLIPGLLLGGFINANNPLHFYLMVPFIALCLIIGFLDITRLLKDKLL